MQAWTRFLGWGVVLVGVILSTALAWPKVWAIALALLLWALVARSRRGGRERPWVAALAVAGCLLFAAHQTKVAFRTENVLAVALLVANAGFLLFRKGPAKTSLNLYAHVIAFLTFYFPPATRPIWRHGWDAGLAGAVLALWAIVVLEPPLGPAPPGRAAPSRASEHR